MKSDGTTEHGLEQRRHMQYEYLPSLATPSHIVFTMPHEHKILMGHDALEFSETQSSYKANVLCLVLNKQGHW